MFCPKCGAKAIEGAFFCEKCGARVTSNTVGTTSAGDVYVLMQENASNCPEIKKVNFQQKMGITMLKGKKNRYFVGFSRGAFRLSVCPKFLLSIHRVIFWLVILVTVDLLVQGIDLEEIYPLSGWCLLIGGLGGIVSEIICKGERKKVVSFIKETCSKAVCIKEPVTPVIEPLLSHPRLWFSGFSLPVASVIQPILYSVIALAGAAALIAGSGILDGMRTFGHHESVYDAYDDASETGTYIPSTDAEAVLLSNQYANEEEGIFFMYPGDWTETKIDGAIFCISAPANSIGFSNTIIAVKYEGYEGDDAYLGEEIFSASTADFEEWYSNSLQDVQVTEASDVILNGYSMRKVMYSWSDSRGTYICVSFYYTMNGGLYEVCCTSLADSFAEDEAVLDAVMDSYTVTAAEGAAFLPDFSQIINMYEGSWHGLEYVNDRLYMEINYVDGNGGCFDISVSWGSGASELTEWDLTGTCENGVIHYTGTELEWYVDDPYGGAGTRVVSEAEEGILWFGDDGLLHWDDYTEASGESYILEKSF